MKRRVLAFLALGLAMALTSCDRPTSEKIETWKGTQKGPDKIEATLRNEKVAPRLRAEAAAALVEIGRPEKVDEIMASLDAGARGEILKTLTDIHIAGLGSPQVPKAREARDGLFSVRQYAGPEEQKRIDSALLASMEKDLAEGRFTGGRHSLDKILVALGPVAGPMLVRLLGDPKAPIKGLAELVVKVADEPTRDKAGAALLGRVQGVRELPADVWLSLGVIGGPTVARFLSEKLEHGKADDGIAAAKALQQSRFPAVLPLALKIAGDPKVGRELRGESFGIIEKVGGPEAQQWLLAIVAKDKDDIVRYRAHEAALEVGKAAAIVPALEALPTQASYKREDVVDFLVKDITKVGPSAKPQVLAALSSRSPVARMAAVLALEAPLPASPKARLGATADAPMLLALANDDATLKGFPKGMTVGAEAKRVAAMLQGKGN